MAQEVRQRTLQYKRATFLKAGNFNLESMLVAAVSKLDDVNKREEKLSEGAAAYRVVSSAKKRHGMMTGRMLQYTPGQRQSLLERDDANKDYALSGALPPRGRDNKQREFVESILYFAVKDNHIMIIGSSVLNPRSFENHINWLLSKAGQLKEDENSLLLADQPTKDAERKLAKYPIKSIEFGSRLRFGRPETDEPTSKTAKIEPVGEAAEALSAYLGKWFGGKRLQEALNDENLKVTLTVKYVSHAKSEKGFEVMEQLAIAGRHFDEDDCVVRLAGGGKVKGKELKISTPIDVKVDDEGLAVEADLWPDMSSWLQGRIREGLVPEK